MKPRVQQGHGHDLDHLLLVEPRHGGLPEEAAGQKGADHGKEFDKYSEKLIELEKADILGENRNEDEMNASVRYQSQLLHPDTPLKKEVRELEVGQGAGVQRSMMMMEELG